MSPRDPSEQPLAVVYRGNTRSRRYAIFLFLLIGLLSAGRPTCAASQAEAPPPRHPIQTTSPQAQQAFDRGLELLYAFDYDAAIASFRQAAGLDPRAAMPHWGI